MEKLYTWYFDLRVGLLKFNHVIDSPPPTFLVVMGMVSLFRVYFKKNNPFDFE